MEDAMREQVAATTNLINWLAQGGLGNEGGGGGPTHVPQPQEDPKPQFCMSSERISNHLLPEDQTQLWLSTGSWKWRRSDGLLVLRTWPMT